MPVVESQLVEVFVYFESPGIREYLLMKRSDAVIYPGIWSVCAGKIKPGERAFEAARRELLEETGIIPAELYSVDTVNAFYDALSDKLHVAPVFLAKAQSKDVLINFEHTEFAWKQLHEAVHMLHWISHKNNIELIEKCLSDVEYRRSLNLIS